MTASDNFGQMLERTGTSREPDTLASGFNDMMRGLAAAEAAEPALAHLLGRCQV